MTTEDKTIYSNSDFAVPSADNKKSSAWQKVTIGGVSAIALGAGAVAAANLWHDVNDQPSQNDNDATAGGSHHVGVPDELPVAEVDQNLSFGQAFAAAREQVGPGGVFHWHGGVYGTYTANEWDNLSADEHSQFARQAQPEIVAEAQHPTGPTAGHHHDPGAAHPTVHHEPQPEPDPQPDPEASSVRFLGVESAEIEGHRVNLGHMSVNDQEVTLVDLDDNRVFDVAVSDVNHNNRLDDNEVIDISDQQITVEAFAQAAAEESVAQGPAEPGLVSQPVEPDLAPDMPDYVNDADLNAI